MSDNLVERLRVKNTYAGPDFATPFADPVKLEAADRIEALEAENARLSEIIFGVGVNLWDRAELSERDDAGNRTILLWHPSGNPIAVLRVDRHDANLGAMHVELLMSDLLDVFAAREKARAALQDTKKTPTD